MTDNKLSDAYQEAVRAYEAAKAGIGNRVETFTRFLVAEKVLAARMALADRSLARLRTRYSA
jgi:hypothetical protein